MNANLKTLNVTDLDFVEIKQNLIEFLKNQDEIKDFDFEGSIMNVLLDVLAYNTHYQSYYLNMIANELFLDSALLRSSVVSKAKHLNYLPRSMTAATANIELEVFPHDNPVSVVLDKNTKFTGAVGDQQFIFVPTKTYTIQRRTINGKAIYRRSGIVLKQGIPVSYSWKVDRKNPNQKFVIPNPNVDTSTLIVHVKYNPNSDFKEEFKLAKDTSRISGEDNVYYLQEVDDGLFEIFFGDGVLGKQLENNNEVIIDYLTTSGLDANGCAAFNTKESIGTYSEKSVLTEMKAMGGDDRETTDSIRFNAPRTFEGQSRAVTIRDYMTTLPKVYPNINSMNVWGGEDNDPPYYGRVMISIKPDNGYYLSEVVKKSIEQELIKEWSIVSITPMIVDPDYTYLILDLNVKFNEQITILSADGVGKKVETAMDKYNNEVLNKFESYFRYSKFVTMIDGAESSITNNMTRVRMRKPVVPTMHTSTVYNINFNNAIVPGSLKTSYFDVGNPFIEGAVPLQRYFVDDEMGNVNLNVVINGKEQTYVSNIGSVNYDTGVVNIKPVKINHYEGDAIDFICKPQNTDVVPKNNQILVIDMINSSITVEDDLDLR